MESITSWISIISTFSVLAPLFLLSKNFKDYEFEIKALAPYLLVGFLMDVSSWYFYTTNDRSTLNFIQDDYDLFEALFLCWFVGRVSPSRIINIFYNWLWFFLLPFWAMRFYNPDSVAWFKTSTQLIIAFTSSFLILKLVEKKEDVSHNLHVWILLGIFFYCFCSYFILGTLVLVFTKVWFSHNLINITTNLIYCIGFIRSKHELAAKA